MMLTVPISFASDADAYTNGSYGAFFTADDGLTNEEYLLLTGEDDVEGLLPIESILSNHDISYDVIDCDLKINGFSRGGGEKFEGRTDYYTSLEYLDITFEAEILITSGSDYIMDNGRIEGDFSDLEAYLGVDAFSIGDKLILKGDYTEYFSNINTITYVDVSDTQCIQKDDSVVSDGIESWDVDVQYLPGGDSDSMKEFTIVTDLRGNMVFSVNYTFDKEVTQLVVGDSYTATYCYDTDFVASKINVIFDGKDHNKMINLGVEVPTEPETRMLREYNFDDPADLGIIGDIPYFKELLFYGSELSNDQLKTKADEFGSYGETYAALESESSRLTSSLMDDGDDDDDSKLFLYIGIGAGVVAVIVIGGLVFFFLKRRS